MKILSKLHFQAPGSLTCPLKFCSVSLSFLVGRKATCELLLPLRTRGRCCPTDPGRKLHSGGTFLLSFCWETQGIQTLLLGPAVTLGQQLMGVRTSLGKPHKLCMSRRGLSLAGFGSHIPGVPHCSGRDSVATSPRPVATATLAVTLWHLWPPVTGSMCRWGWGTGTAHQLLLFFLTPILPLFRL